MLRALLLLKRGDFRAALEVADTGLRHIAENLYGHPEHVAYQQAVRAAVLYEFDDSHGGEPGARGQPGCAR